MNLHKGSLLKSSRCSRQKLSSPSSRSTSPNYMDLSYSEAKPMTDSGNQLVELFECIVCSDYALPPIYQCESGHIVCATCRVRMKSCQVCHLPLGIRNLAMEKVSEQILFPCKYVSSGCLSSMSSVHKVQHQLHCDYRPCLCPCPGAQCHWIGSVSDVLSHLHSNHEAITTLQGEDIVFMATDVTLPGSVDWVMLQSCFNVNFLLVLEKQDQPDGTLMYYAVVQLIGSRKQTENFCYRLELRKDRRRLTWEGSPHCIKDGIQSVITTSDCLVFNGQTAAMFSDNNNLAINVTMIFG